MKQEDKELLLQDLCARLPYGIKVQYEGNIFDIDYISPMYEKVKLDIADYYTIDISEIKPFLFPLSSMTEKQCNEFYCKFVENEIDYNDFKEYYFEGGLWQKLLTSIDDCDSVVNWFNKIHFDYRGLIEKGLAIDCTNLNIY
jgi:hypothetical protein